ncbi:hypothetical protein LLA04_10240 [Leuconostoc lactis]|nr:hypothetical protein LLA04_10240 [Leuconostoc lactis]
MQILKKHAKPYRREIILSMLAVVIMAGASLWQPRLLQQVMNAIIADNQQAVWSNGIALVSLAVIGLLAGVINTIFAAKVSLRGLLPISGPMSIVKFNLFHLVILKPFQRVIWSCE